jgi:hypothetical protein
MAMAHDRFGLDDPRDKAACDLYQRTLDIETELRFFYTHVVTWNRLHPDRTPVDPWEIITTMVTELAADGTEASSRLDEQT